ncbi:MAG TPA: ABC transporter permease [Chthoniobacterales bacterium]|jgi:phospholipid/cholesterol/gamma-HCH transport system permease protein
MINKIGQQTKSFLQTVSSVVWLFLNTISEMLESMGRGRSPFRAASLFEQTDRAGVGSVPLTAMVSFFLGLTMAILTGYQLQRFGSERYVPGLVAVAFTRELGPLLTGIVIAARIGAAYTAELGTMTVSEEVEALETMGIGPMRFLVAPRVMAITFLMPCLSVIATLAALISTSLVAWYNLNIAFSYSRDLMLESIMIKDIYTGFVKSVLFGLIIGLVSCYKGLAVQGGAAGVGTATTSSVVIAITTVIGMDTVANIILTNVLP